MLKRIMVAVVTIVALLTFSITALASPSNSNAVQVDNEGRLILPNETASETAGNPMDVPGIK